MNAPSEPSGGDRGSSETAPSIPPREARQRWRLTFHRDPVSADLVGRVAIEGWQATLERSGLPLAQLDAGGRPRVAFAAPLQATAEGEAELAEVFLCERLPAWRVREALEADLPPGHALLGAEDVWLGAPPLPGRVVAADWRVGLEPGGVDAPALAGAAARVIAAPTLPRTRSKGGVDKPYDLRPLIDDIKVAAGRADEPCLIRIRTRFRPELGSGRPEEVVAAVGAEAGAELTIRTIVRERLILAEDRMVVRGRLTEWVSS